MSINVVALERAEIEAFTDLYLAAHPDVARATGLSIHPTRAGVVLAAAGIDVLALNRAMGLGLEGPTPADAVDELLDVLATCGSARFFLPIAPVTGHHQLARTLMERGLSHYNNWVRLTRGVDDLPPLANTDLEVREVGSEAADTFGRIVATAFGYPPEVMGLTVEVVGRRGWRHYLALDGATPVAAAAMHVTDDTAWFGFAATDARHRKRGAQHALIVRRLQDAAAAGCTRISVETAEDSVIRDAPSFRNLKRLGFAVAYARPNYIWKRSSAAVAG